MATAKSIRKPLINLQDIAEQAALSAEMMDQVRAVMLNPTSRKQDLIINLSQLAGYCGVEKGTIVHRMTKGDLPPGNLNTTGSRREFNLSEARAWIRAYRKDKLRPAGAEAVTIAIANFKGGVGKTTTAMTLAQGLSLLGLRVLVIDLDPQGSLTTLFGILPDTEVSEDDTVLPLALGEHTSIRYAIRPTYWDGIDLVAAAPCLFGAEFALPARQTQEPNFEFWNVLNLGIDDVRAEYDVIVIDSPPSLSYITINALMASNGLIMPLPPNALDYASASQFWNLFSDLSSEMLTSRGLDKEFDFIHVLLSRVDSAESTSDIVRTWIQATYKEKVLPVEIPKTAVASSASAEFSTVYDIQKYDGNARTFKRARDAYDQFVRYVESSIRASWDRQVAASKSAKT
ncbi:MAG TPA: AAA family ATPase [Zoogloea sp.]|jgi:chromosome partitioning protein|nr:AAA family ATPase [Zoogloea sp.]